MSLIWIGFQDSLYIALTPLLIRLKIYSVVVSCTFNYSFNVATPGSTSTYKVKNISRPILNANTIK